MRRSFSHLAQISIICLLFGLFTNQALAKVSEDQYSNYQHYLENMRIDDVWKLTLYNRRKVIVAIIDDGIYQNHPDLEGTLWRNEDEIAGNGVDDDNNGYIDDFLGYDFLNKTNEVTQLGTHGTVVAGIIGAIRNNEIGIAGITSYATMMPLITCNDDGCSDDAIIEAIYYAVNNGAQVVNLSISSMLTNGYTDKYNDAIKYAYGNNVVVIVAAGNGDPNGGIGYDLDVIPQSPVCNDGSANMVLGIGAATTDLNYRTNWTNYGSCVDFFAPGENMISTVTPASATDALYEYGFSGTSFATPMVAALAVEVLSGYHNISNIALYNYMEKASINAHIRGSIDGLTLLDSIKRNQNDPNYDFSQDQFKGSFSYINPYLENEEEEKEAAVVESSVSQTFEKDAEQSQFKDAIIALKNRGVVNGYEDGTFKPFNPINRAEFMKIIIGAAGIEPTGKNCFSDVNEEWFASYVCAGMANGIVGGYSDGSFKPEQQINVAEALKITLKAFGIETREVNNDEAWFAPFTEYAKQNNYYLDTFDSDSKQLTREDMAELVYRLMPSE